MKKSLLIVLAILIVTASCALVPIAETDDGVDNVSNIDSNASETQNANPPAWQIAIMYCIMFAGISVIGVMFIKIVKKNKLP